MLQTLAKILSVLSSKQSYDVNNRLLSEVMKQLEMTSMPIRAEQLNRQWETYTVKYHAMDPCVGTQSDLRGHR